MIKKWIKDFIVRKHLFSFYEAQVLSLFEIPFLLLFKKILVATGLPEGIILPYSVDLTRLPIKKLPENLKVIGDLYIEGTPISTLPKGLWVKGSIIADNSHLSCLPDNLKVYKNLQLRNTRITELPKNLRVMGTLDLCGTKINKIPEDILVGRSIWLRNVYLLVPVPKKIRSIYGKYTVANNSTRFILD